jgi:hypothetical protein
LVLAGSCLAWGSSATALEDPTAPLTPELATQLAQGANRPVIVLMRNVLTGDDAARDQAPVMNELRQVNAQRIKAFRAVNSLAAMVSDGEVERLKANPSVAQVIPDVLIHRKGSAGSAKAASSLSPVATPSDTSLVPYVIPGACGLKGAPLLDPEALQTTNTASYDPLAPTARKLGFTGAGVRVAYIADGVDPNNVNFIRPDGTSVFFDYEDFTGDGPGQLTSGDEAFLDANSIAGQGIVTYNVKNFGAQPDPGACNIRIEGVAPGASVMGLNVFGTYEDTTESNFLEAIEYAINAHVDVLNESFGSNPFPDITSTDVTKQFNDAAVAAGITVTVSSGDAGSTSTIGSPGTDPKVISVGASTAFRFYAQTNYAAARYFATSGWLDDNISSLSSGGFTETGSTVDLVAPGDLGFASCDASALFDGCTNFLGQPSIVEESGGTSESAPLTAGAAALVIEAYRKSHHGSSPSPALVKQILTSTATDLGTPATEQGAGLVNSYRAVLLAQSIDAEGRPLSVKATTGQTLLLSQSQLNAVGYPGTPESWTVTVTNPSATGQLVTATGETFGPEEHRQSGVVTLNDDTSLQFANYSGVQNNYAVINFTVPKGADRLNASIAYPGNPGNGNNSRVRLILIDPLGRFAAHSLPQGVGNYGNVDVREPVAGLWTGVIFGDVAAKNGTNGSVPWQVSTQRLVPFGEVDPASFHLEAGQSRTLHVGATTPENPGDAAGSIVISASGDGTDPFVGLERNAIPVTLRSLVDLGLGGEFNGVLTGGNGRPPGQGQVNYYEFNVGPGHQSITANVSLTSDTGDSVGSYLISPDGDALGFGENSLNGTNTDALTAYTLNPKPGTWTLVVDFAEPVVGDEIAQAFVGNIQLDAAKASAPKLPNGQRELLTAGVPVTVPLRITNNGWAPQAYFIDARLDVPVTTSLASQSPPGSSQGYALPLGSTSDTSAPLWLVPTQTSRVVTEATATLPIEFDFGPDQGDPDLFGAPTSPSTAAGFFAPSGGTVQPGFWYASPDEIGPFPNGAATGFANMTMTAKTLAFDSAVTSPTGDLWLASLDPTAFNNFAPVTLDPGQSTVVDVTITPAGPSGTLVKGTLYVDTFIGGVPPYFQLSGDQMSSIPYAYTIR